MALSCRTGQSQGAKTHAAHALPGGQKLDEVGDPATRTESPETLSATISFLRLDAETPVCHAQREVTDNTANAELDTILRRDKTRVEHMRTCPLREDSPQGSDRPASWNSSDATCCPKLRSPFDAQHLGEKLYRIVRKHAFAEGYGYMPQSYKLAGSGSYSSVPKGPLEMAATERQSQRSLVSSSLRVKATASEIPTDDHMTRSPADSRPTVVRTWQRETGELVDYHVPMVGFGFSSFPTAEAFLLLFAVAIAWTAAWGCLQ
ncbi:hypothetical protein F5Y17DRAFT_184239 [Xylariaceae sp. FL0594]|nr:hypothetical protein F5Y17DRAFT_184239 [Xylariaceae sp. FL0594]